MLAASYIVGKKFGSFPSNFFTQPFQYFQIVNLVDCLSSWYKFIMNNTSNISSRTLVPYHIYSHEGKRSKNGRVEQLKAMEYGSRKASPDVLNPHAPIFGIKFSDRLTNFLTPMFVHFEQ